MVCTGKRTSAHAWPPRPARWASHPRRTLMIPQQSSRKSGACLTVCGDLGVAGRRAIFRLNHERIEIRSTLLTALMLLLLIGRAPAAEARTIESFNRLE